MDPAHDLKRTTAGRMSLWRRMALIAVPFSASALQRTG